MNIEIEDPLLVPLGCATHRVERDERWHSLECQLSSSLEDAYPSKAFHAVNGYALRRMTRFLNRKGLRWYRLKFPDPCYDEH